MPRSTHPLETVRFTTKSPLNTEMPQSKKGKARKQKTIRGGRQKALFLPMAREAVDSMMLQIRLALEVIRAGQADRQSANCLAQALVLTGFITEAGHGVLDSTFLRNVEEALNEVLTTGAETGVWRFTPQLADDLRIVVNEHDLQLRETRLDVIFHASDRLDLLFKRNGSESSGVEGQKAGNTTTRSCVQLDANATYGPVPPPADAVPVIP